MANIKGGKKCRGCGRFFIAQGGRGKVCEECGKLIALGHSKDLLEFERLREKFNREHNTDYTYGKFAEYIDYIKARVKR